MYLQTFFYFTSSPGKDLVPLFFLDNSVVRAGLIDSQVDVLCKLCTSFTWVTGLPMELEQICLKDSWKAIPLEGTATSAGTENPVEFPIFSGSWQACIKEDRFLQSDDPARLARFFRKWVRRSWSFNGSVFFAAFQRQQVSILLLSQCFRREIQYSTIFYLEEKLNRPTSFDKKKYN